MLSDNNQIPTLDLKEFENNRTMFVHELGNAFENIGFAIIKNHHLSKELIDDLYDQVKKFFALPEDIKKKYEKAELYGQRGYISKGREIAKGKDVPDLKEFFHVGQPDSNKLDEYPSNIWPDEVPAFKSALERAYEKLEQTGIVLLRAIALFLGLDEKYFDDKAMKGNSILRPIHYFPLKNIPMQEGAVRAAEHGDINLITLLMGASAEGLQVLKRSNEWVSVNANHDQLIINVGDMLDRLTNHQLKSTIHRVVNPSKSMLDQSRYSIPFFMHPISSMDLSCLPSCVSEKYPRLYDDITAGEYLNQRLEEIGLKK